jgi:hypothetical protein
VAANGQGRTYIFLSYHLGRLGLKCSNGVELSKRAIDLWFWYGFAFLTAVEVLDGFSSEWGASSGDIIANASGTALLSQELLWKEQRITPKFSFHTTQYAIQTQCFRELTCGTNSKDYNGQTYWLSVNLHSFYKGSKSLNGLI